MQSEKSAMYTCTRRMNLTDERSSGRQIFRVSGVQLYSKQRPLPPTQHIDTELQKEGKLETNG